MYRLTLLLALLLLLCPETRCQLPPGTARSAVSYADAGLPTDAFSLFANPALLTHLPGKNLSLHYCPSQFGLPELASYSAAGTFGVYGVSAAAAVSSYGFSLYRETDIAAGAGYQILPDLSFGATLHFKKVGIAGYGNGVARAVDAGFIYHAIPEAGFGAAVINLNRGKYAGSDAALPTLLRTGIGITAADWVRGGITIEKESNRKFRVLTGVEFTIEEALSVSGGYQTEPVVITGGVGICWKNIRADYAIQEHAELGSTHMFGASFTFDVLR